MARKKKQDMKKLKNELIIGRIYKVQNHGYKPHNGKLGILCLFRPSNCVTNSDGPFPYLIRFSPEHNDYSFCHKDQIIEIEDWEADRLHVEES